MHRCIDGFRCGLCMGVLHRRIEAHGKYTFLGLDSPLSILRGSSESLVIYLVSLPNQCLLTRWISSSVESAKLFFLSPTFLNIIPLIRFSGLSNSLRLLPSGYTMYLPYQGGGAGLVDSHTSWGYLERSGNIYLPGLSRQSRPRRG